MDDIELRTRVGAADLLATYQFLADSGKTRELSELFVADAVYKTNTEELVGSGGLDHWGTYRDEVVRAEDGWRFTRRKVKVEGHIPGSPVVSLLGLPAVGADA
jgi:hypothetical protein